MSIEAEPTIHRLPKIKLQTYPCRNFDTCGNLVERQKSGIFTCISCKIKRKTLASKKNKWKKPKKQKHWWSNL